MRLSERYSSDKEAIKEIREFLSSSTFLSGLLDADDLYEYFETSLSEDLDILASSSFGPPLRYEYPKVGIVEAMPYNDSYEIEFDREIVEEILEELVDEDPERFAELVDKIAVIASHELTHQQQFDKSGGRVVPFKDDSDEAYLASPREVDAHAVGAVEELLSLGLSPQDILQNLSSSKGVEKLIQSDQFYKYYKVIYPLIDQKKYSKVWKQFIGTMYEILEEEA